MVRTLFSSYLRRLAKRISPEKSKELPDLGGKPIKGDLGHLEKVLRGLAVPQSDKLRAVEELRRVGGADVLSRAYLEGKYTRGKIKRRGEPSPKIPGDQLDWEVREAIIQALGSIEGKGEGAVWQALDDKSPEVRKMALRAVSQKKMMDAADDVAELLKDNLEGVLVDTVTVLGDLGVRSDKVIDGLQDVADRMVKKYVPGTGTRGGAGLMLVSAIEALGKIGGSKVEKILEGYQKSDDETIAMAAAKYMPKSDKSKKESK